MYQQKNKLSGRNQHIFSHVFFHFLYVYNFLLKKLLIVDLPFALCVPVTSYQNQNVIIVATQSFIFFEWIIDDMIMCA